MKRTPSLARRANSRNSFLDRASHVAYGVRRLFPVKEDRVMADESSEGKAAGKTSGWLKAFLGTCAGLLSGALMMYLSPLLDRVVKPARPLANFAVEHQGLTVTFHNSSSGGDGWWDFGDGSALEPASAKQPTVSHAYTAPGTYTAKLTLRNLLNEENERTVTLNLDGGATGPPAIVSLEAVPVSPDCCAPATFRLTGKTKNADLLVWSRGDDQPLEVVTDVARDGAQDRYVTFPKPGGYVVKLAAIKGKQAEEKSVVVSVGVPRPGTVTAILKVASEATCVERDYRPVSVTETFTAGNSPSQPISRQIVARQGFEISAAVIERVSGQGGKDLHVQLSADRRSAQLTGRLERDVLGLLRKNHTQPTLVVKLLVTEERRTRVKQPAIPLSTTLTLPGTATMALPPTPCDWSDVQCQLRLELHDGDQVVWPEAPLPRNAYLTLRNRRYVLNATPAGGQVRIDLAEARPGLTSAN
jgi:PKD repeat protein